MSLRIRQVKPDFWRDVRLSDLSDTDRLVYIGLWMEADDTGWFREDVAEIATDLYPYQSRGTREKKVSAALDRLRQHGRIQGHPCGHSYLPTLTKHQRLASPEKQAKTTYREHQGCVPAEPRGEPRETAGNMQVPALARAGGNGKEREGKEREGGVRGGAAPAAGPFDVIDGRLTKRGAA
jgi:hypothetical protein